MSSDKTINIDIKIIDFSVESEAIFYLSSDLILIFFQILCGDEEWYLRLKKC